MIPNQDFGTFDIATSQIFTENKKPFHTLEKLNYKYTPTIRVPQIHIHTYHLIYGLMVHQLHLLPSTPMLIIVPIDLIFPHCALWTLSALLLAF